MSGNSGLLTVDGNPRSKTGKGYARQLRRAGKIPAVILEKGKSTPIELDSKLLPKIYKNGRVFNLNLEGASKQVKIHEVQVDPKKRTAKHVDLMYVK